MNNLNLISEKMFNAVLNGVNGGTFSVLDGELEEFKDGYIVGVTGFQVPRAYFVNSKYPIKVLFDCLNDFKLGEFVYVGFWENNGIIYIDGVYHVNNLGKALKLAAENKQLAVWDCKEQKEIKL